MLKCKSPFEALKRYASSYYDVVVVGGGLVGNAMACSLGKSAKFASKKILLLEGGMPKGLPRSLPEMYSNRVSAVSPASITLFKNLGVWDKVQSHRVKKVERLHVIDSCSTSEITFDQPDRGHEIAYIIENDLIVSALYDELRKTGVDIKTGSSVKECGIPSNLRDLTKLSLTDGSSLETSLVIGADGFKSIVRESMGNDYTAWNYEQSGVVATLNIQTTTGKNDVAWQRFTRLGPIALLPLTDTLSSLVWTTTTEDAQRLTKVPEDQFIDELNHFLFTDEDQNATVNQTLFMLSRFQPSHKYRAVPPEVISLQSDTRAAFPLGFGHSHSYIGHRSAVIGDAAHRIHPLAGQGVNLGWNDVHLLTKVLEKAQADGADLGSTTYLAEYDSAAQKHNVPVMVCVDWLNRLYRTDAAALVALRSIGLAAFNQLTPLKDFVVRQLSVSK